MPKKDSNQAQKDFYSPDAQKAARKSKWYDDITRTLDKCPFCDLKDKYFVAEKGNMVLTVNLFPYIDGHLMVIPRRHVEKMSELTVEEWQDAKYLIDLGVAVVKLEVSAENINVLYREGGKSGNSLKHLHIHILPITPEFMSYKKQKFVWTFQDIKLAPIEMAEKLRKSANHQVGLSEKRGSELSERARHASGSKSDINLGFMKKACLLCDRSLCGYKTGCVAVKDGEFLFEGWNETLHGEIYCQDGECIREKLHLHGGKEPEKVCSIHAEASVVAQSAAAGVSLKGAEIYVTTFPCLICARLLVKAGVSKVHYMSDYMGENLGFALFEANHIEVEQIKEEDVWQEEK